MSRLIMILLCFEYAFNAPDNDVDFNCALAHSICRFFFDLRKAISISLSRFPTGLYKLTLKHLTFRYETCNEKKFHADEFNKGADRFAHLRRLISAFGDRYMAGSV